MQDRKERLEVIHENKVEVGRHHLHKKVTEVQMHRSGAKVSGQ